MPAQSNSGLAAVRIAGRDYPVVNERTCRTCQSPLRAEAERQMVQGRTWAAIARDLPPEAGLSPRNLADHFRHGHLPVAEPAIQQLAEQDADQRGQDLKPAIDAVADYLDFARRVVGRVSRLVETGQAEPRVSDALRAAELLARFDPDPGPQLDVETFTAAFIEYFEAAEDIMSPEQFRTFGHQLRENATLARLEAAYERRIGA